MAEENKSIPADDEAEKLPAPKKRGRRKKADAAPSPDITASELVPEAEPIQAAEAEQAADEPIQAAEAEQAADEPIQAAEDEQAADEPIQAAEAEQVTDEPIQTAEAEQAADEPIQAAEAEQVTDEPQNDSDAADADSGNTASLPLERIIDSEDGASDYDDTASDGEAIEAASDEDKAVFFEHFSDTAALTYLSDSVDGDAEPESCGEAEQLSLFNTDEADAEAEGGANSDSAETAREPKQKRRYEISPDEKEYTPEKPRRVDARFDLIELFVFTLVVIMIITTFFFKHSIVSGPSMMSTLNDGDHLIISDFLYEPKQYDVVVIHDPEAHSEGAIVKRIVAVGGQTVRLERRLVPEKSDIYLYYSLTVYVDGVKLDESFVYYDGADYISINPTLHERIDYKLIPGTEESPYERYEYEIYEYKVPLNEVYVLGDHRNDSKDSRSFGSVNVDKILGRVLIRIYPFDDFGTVN